MNKNKQTLRISRQAGFTLMEILVVMVIIAILVGIGLGSFRSSQIKSTDAKRTSAIDQVAKALNVFYADKGYYPVDDDAGSIKVYWNSGADSVVFDWGDKFYDPTIGDDDATVYMIELPEDPARGRSYYYAAFHREYSGGSFTWSEHNDGVSDNEAEGYRIYTKLQNENDERILGDIAGTNCSVSSSTPCNFVLPSTNLGLTSPP